jgi:hypothetical protein
MKPKHVGMHFCKLKEEDKVERERRCIYLVLRTATYLTLTLALGGVLLSCQKYNSAVKDATRMANEGTMV